MKYEGREIKSAMAANNITLELLTEYINKETEQQLKANTVGKIVRGDRNNKSAEDVIEALFSTWIEGQRALEKRVGGVMIPESLNNDNLKKI